LAAAAAAAAGFSRLGTSGKSRRTGACAFLGACPLLLLRLLLLLLHLSLLLLLPRLEVALRRLWRPLPRLGVDLRRPQLSLQVGKGRHPPR
jgi:hypothetical protein